MLVNPNSSSHLMSVLKSIVCIFILAQSGISFAQSSVSYEKARVLAINNVQIASEAAGIVRRIGVETGVDVLQGQTLASLNRETFEAEYEVAVEEERIARLEAANDANLQFARKSKEVNQKLLERGRHARSNYEKSISRTDIERLQLELEQSVLSTQQAEMEREVASMTASMKSRIREAAAINLDHREIRSPLNGRVAQVYVQNGQWVNAGEPIARVIDLKHLRIQGFFNKDHMFQIRSGNQAVFEYSIGTQEFQIPVKVTYVGSEIIDDIFQVWADVENKDGQLVPGVKGRLTIELIDKND